MLVGGRRHSGLGGFRYEQVPVSEATVRVLLSHGSRLLYLEPSMIVASVQHAVVEDVHLLQIVDSVCEVGYVVVLSRDLFHDPIEQIPLVWPVGVIRIDGEPSTPGVLVTFIGFACEEAIGQIVNGFQVRQFQVDALDRVA